MSLVQARHVIQVQLNAMAAYGVWDRACVDQTRAAMNAPGMRLILDSDASDSESEAEPVPKRACREDDAYLARLADRCPGSTRKYRRRPNPPPACRHCGMARAAHETRNDRSNLCPGHVGRCFQAAKVDPDPDPPCALCAQPRSAHLSGLMQYARQLEIAIHENALHIERLGHARAQCVAASAGP